MFRQGLEDEDAQERLSRPMNLLCVLGFASLFFITLENSQQGGCNRLNLAMCDNRLRSCHGQGVSKCFCTQQYLKCVHDIRCDDTYPAYWDLLRHKCLSLGCDRDQCWLGVNGTSAVPTPPPSQPAEIEGDATHCNQCYSRLVSCQHGQTFLTSNTTDCFCLEEFLACSNAHSCLDLESQALVTSQCLNEWHCLKPQCSPKHSHGRYCEYKSKGLMAILTGLVATTVVYGGLHICIAHDAWSIPYEDNVGDPRHQWAGFAKAALLGPLSMWCRPPVRSQFYQAGTWLGWSAFAAVIGITSTLVYLIPFKHFQRGTREKDYASLDATCFLLTSCAAVATFSGCTLLVCSITFLFKRSRIRSTLAVGGIQMTPLGHHHHHHPHAAGDRDMGDEMERREDSDGTELDTPHAQHDRHEPMPQPHGEEGGDEGEGEEEPLQDHAQQLAGRSRLQRSSSNASSQEGAAPTSRLLDRNEQSDQLRSP